MMLTELSLEGLGGSRRPELMRKIIIVGGKAVGKTSFIRRFVDKPIAGLKYVPTIGVDVIVYPMMYGETPVYLHFWDVSYAELNASVSHHALIFNNVSGIFLVIDVSSRESLEAIDAWQKLLAKYVPGRVPRMLLAHKADLFSEAQCVVNDRLLETYKREAGLTDWCWTVGHEHFGDYVANRSSKSKPVSDAVQLLVDHILREFGPALPGLSTPTDGMGRGLMTPEPGGLPGHGGSGASAGGGGTETTPSPMHATRYRYRRRRRSPSQAAPSSSSSCPIGPRIVDFDDMGFSDDDGDDEIDSADKSIQSYQPLQGWLSSEDLEVFFKKAGPAGALQVDDDDDDDRRREQEVGKRRKDVRGLDEARKHDPGWRHLAGSIGRAEAEQILRSRPIGAFLLRRVDERSLRLSYKTQHSVEHAPIVFNGLAWSVVRSSQGPPRGSTEHQKPTPCFATLAELLRFFSKKAIVGLSFRRIPGTNKYELIKEGEGDVGVQLYSRRKQQEQGKQESKRPTQELAVNTNPRPSIPGSKEILELFKQLQVLIASATAVEERGSLSADGEELVEEGGSRRDGDDDKGEERGTTITRGGIATARGSTGVEAKMRSRVLLQLCRKSCAKILTAIHTKESSPRTTLPYLMTISDQEQQDAKGLYDPKVVISQIEAVDGQILQLLCNAMRAAQHHGTSRAGVAVCNNNVDMKAFREGLACWRTFLETLRLKMETKTQ